MEMRCPISPKTENIIQLSNGSSKKLKLQIAKSQAGIGGGTYVGWAYIEYYINNTKFGKYDGDWMNTATGGTFETIITINENGWSSERKY